MSLHYTTPAPESRGLQEVLYLHALWRRGPPRHLNPNLRPANPTAFKDNKNKNSNKKKNRKKKRQQKPSDAPAVAEIEWPCPPVPAPNSEPTGWGDLAPTPSPAQPRPPPSAEDQARTAALLAQKLGLRACEEFFSPKKNGSDDEDDDEEEEEDDPMDEDGGVESGDFRFLLGLFEKDGDLRGYYEKNCEKGGFCCLVCEGIGAKKGRRFPDCVGLVQHCNSISKTKRRGAHRALAKVVCQVLAWDIKRLPSIVLDLGDPLGKSLEKAAELKEASRVEDATDEKEELRKEVAEPVKTNNGDQMDCIGTKETTDLPNVNKEGANDEIIELLKEVGESVEANNGNLMEHNETREVINLSKKVQDNMTEEGNPAESEELLL